MTCRCLICAAEVERDEACPTCRLSGTAALVEWDVTLTVNWVELTMLCLAASQLYDMHREDLPPTQYTILQAIIQRLYQHRPNVGSPPPLTLDDALREMGRVDLSRTTDN